MGQAHLVNISPDRVRKEPVGLVPGNLAVNGPVSYTHLLKRINMHSMMSFFDDRQFVRTIPVSIL